MLKTIHAVLFDLDGTLADTAPDLIAALNDSLQAAGYPIKSATHLRNAASHGSLHLVKAAIPDEPEAVQAQIQQQLLQRYTQINGKHAHLYEGIAPLLAILADKNIPIGIVTNKHACFTRPLVHTLGLTQQSVTIISGNSTTHSKPHTAPMLLAAQQLQVNCEHILYIGDAERDLIAAQNANMIGGVALWGYINKHDEPCHWPAKYRFHHPLEFAVLFD
ncbi:HAD family hydrolase [Shewanella intestini]|uniref:HAD-IA family hydrolase n=1 Tax=Shewanella intestini TaxID=2017544 RepID=A0ABS5HZW9_9GAMM|nr:MULTISPECIES: HAD-IA family hydrolase [Shewanella]MBR9727221.1 HAD-IA family hydrolase [Shewanella intestini]MRG36023.1 HAD-IA family hydrolase [Shewanella sp. XMDDZSB0408]